MTIMAAVKHEVDAVIQEYLEEQPELTTGWSAKLVGTDNTLEQLGFERTRDEWHLRTLDRAQQTTVKHWHGLGTQLNAGWMNWDIQCAGG